MNCQITDTVAEMTCYPGSIGVSAAYETARMATSAYIGRMGGALEVISMTGPNVPPAARAIASASARASRTASAIAVRLISAAFEAENWTLLI